MTSKEEILNLGRGLPSPDVFPVDMLKKCTTELLESSDRAVWGTYGECPGVSQCRIALSEYISREVGHTVTKDDLAITCGVSGAIDIVLQQYSKPGDQIVIENPTYYEAKNFVAEYKLQPVPIDSGPNGFDLEKLEEKLENHLISPKLMYIVSDFSNPRGITLSESKRIKLVELAHKFNFLVISDEVYQLLYFTPDAKPPKPLALFDIKSESTLGGVVSLSSISKTVMPSLRIGWILCLNRERLGTFFNRAVETSGGLHSFYTAGLFTKSLELGLFDARLQELRDLYRERCNAMIEGIEDIQLAMNNKFPEREGKIEFYRPRGGFFIWLQFPEWVNIQEIIQELENHNTSVMHGTRAAYSDSVGKNSIRLCFVYYSPEILKQGLRTLRDLLTKD